MKLFVRTAAALVILLGGCKAAKQEGPQPEPGAKPSAKPGARVGRGTPTYYMRSGKGKIIYSVVESGTGIDSVQVMMSRDGCQTWKEFKTSKKSEGEFIYEAKDEGVFDFVTLAMDKIGNREKDIGPGTEADFRVVVDRSAPLVAAKGVSSGAPAAPGTVFEYSWTIEDPYLQPASTEIQVRLKGQTAWRSVAKGLPAKGSTRVTMPEVSDGVVEVRVAARDRAGNWGYAAAGNVAFDRLPPRGKIVGPAITSHLDVEIKYQVTDPGAADLASVTLWITANDGQSWRRLADAPPGGKSVKVRLPRPGAYGLALSAVDTVGNRLNPPARKAKPDFTIHTATAAPKLELLAKLTGKAFSSRDTLNVKWKASAPNLTARPISVEFSSDGGKRWVVVAKALENTGSFSWKPRRVDSAQCLLRLTARDILGNKSQVTSDPFTLDNKSPESTVRFEPIVDENGKPKPKPKPAPKSRKRGKRSR